MFSARKIERIVGSRYQYHSGVELCYHCGPSDSIISARPVPPVVALKQKIEESLLLLLFCVVDIKRGKRSFSSTIFVEIFKGELTVI